MSSTKPHILFVSHDANRAGAQLFLLNIMKEYKRKGYELGICFLNTWGPLLADFKNIAEVYPAIESKSILEKIGSKLGLSVKRHKKLSAAKFDLIYANTIASAPLAVSLKRELKVPLLTHIHELSYSIEMYSSASDRKQLFELSDNVVACSNAVHQNLIATYSVLDPTKVKTVHSFIDNAAVRSKMAQMSKESVVEKYNLPKDVFFVGACGNSEYRKGLDIFAELVNVFQNKSNALKTHFIWIGAQPDGDYFEKVQHYIAEHQLVDKITLIPPTPDAVSIINALDVFVVSSREDPFPLVMLEAALCQKPILGFKETGGCEEFVGQKAGILSPLEDVQHMSEQLNQLLDNETLRRQFGEYGQMQVNEIYNFDSSFMKLDGIISSLVLA